MQVTELGLKGDSTQLGASSLLHSQQTETLSFHRVHNYVFQL